MMAPVYHKKYKWGANVGVRKKAVVDLPEVRRSMVIGIVWKRMDPLFRAVGFGLLVCFMKNKSSKILRR